MKRVAFDSPVVHRIDVLESAKSEVNAFEDCMDFGGLCPLLCSALHSYGLLEDYIYFSVDMDALKKFFPLYTHDNAVEFDARQNVSETDFWWPPYKWNKKGGRMRFLNWLIEQYKDDETDLRAIV